MSLVRNQIDMSSFNITLYVDPVNGNDNNIGTSLSTAKKTIKGAITSTPRKLSMVVIRLTDNAEHVIDSTIDMYERSVWFFRHPSATSNPVIRINDNITMFASNSFGGGKVISRINFQHCNVNIGSNSILFSGSGGNTWLQFINGNIFNSSNLDSKLISYGGQQMVLLSFKYNKTTYIPNNWIEVRDNSILNVYTTNGSQFYSDNESTQITLKDAISGIVYDANGVPKNLLGVID